MLVFLELARPFLGDLIFDPAMDHVPEGAMFFGKFEIHVSLPVFV